jgi:hypothetical protein
VNPFSKSKSNGTQVPATITLPSNSKPTPAGRERLKFTVDGLVAAHAAIEDLQERIQRFDSIISDAQRASTVLQAAINEDGGKSLSAFSAGETAVDHPINALVALAKSSREAAVAAVEILPATRAALDNARAQLADLELKKASELNKLVASYINLTAEKYLKTFQTLATLHDQLVGASFVQESNLLPGEAIHVRLTHGSLIAPRFISSAMGTSDDAPQLLHRVNQHVADQSAARWAELRSRLDIDVDADVSDLVMPATHN